MLCYSRLRRRRRSRCFLGRFCCRGRSGRIGDSRGRDAELTFASDGLDTRQIFAQLAHFLEADRLSHFELELQTKELVGGLALLMQKLVRTKISDLLDIHLEPISSFGFQVSAKPVAHFIAEHWLSRSCFGLA